MKSPITLLVLIISLGSACLAEPGKYFSASGNALVARKAVGNAIVDPQADPETVDPKTEYEALSRELRLSYEEHRLALAQTVPRNRQALRKAWLESKQADTDRLKALSKEIVAQRRSAAPRLPIAVPGPPQAAPEIQGKSENELRRMGVPVDSVHRK